MERLAKGLILVRGAGPDGKVNPNFLYLTGLDAPEGALLLAPGGTRVRAGRSNPGPGYVSGAVVQQVLFLPPTDPLAARWGEGSRYTYERTDPDRIGVDLVLSTALMSAVLTGSLSSAKRLQYIRGFPVSLQGEDDDDTRFTRHIASRFLNVELRDATPDIEEMRRIKDETEIAAIEKSVGVVAEAFERVFDVVAEGLLEHEIEAEIARVYRRHGGVHAFDPIVAAGSNALVLHYTANATRLEHGDLLLIDTGVSIGDYKADITRTIPVDGKFNDRQRELYDVVLAAQQAVIDDCRPGVLIGDLHARAHETIAAAGHGEYFVHGIGHHLGLETHDVGDIYRPLEAGCVITVEPGVYRVKEEIGIRIEDDVLIESDGARVLGPGIPKTADEVEARLARRG